MVGRVGAPHGIAGALRITSATQPPDNLERYRPWLVGRDGDFREVKVLSLTPAGRGYVAMFEGIDDRERARALTGLSIAVPRAVLPELPVDEEYYWQDLIGMTVTDTAGRRLGRVRELIATGANDVLVIDDGTRETLVPFAAGFVTNVNLAERVLVVDWQDPI